MKRRGFLKSTAIMTTAALSPGVASAAERAESPARRALEFYELRKYQLRRGPMQKRFDDFYSQVVMPAYKKMGIGRVGVFNVMVGPDSPTTYVLIPHPSMASVTSVADQLRAGGDFQKNEFVNAPATDPSYVRTQSSILRSSRAVPKIEVPAATAEKKARLFELRIYESHSKSANLKKIEMFDEGEIAIFRRTGLTPVFFGETLVGDQMPNLTYMLVFESLAAREKNWATFVADPEWKKLSAKPGFTDPEIVSCISSVLLRPTAYSEI